MTRTAMGKLMEHWHPTKALAFGQLLARVSTPYKSGENIPEGSWTGFGPSYNQRTNMPRNPLNAIRNLIDGGKKEMAYEMERAASAMPLGVVKQRTFREQIQDQIAHHKSRITELEEVLSSMTPEVEKFVEALQKANL